MPDPTRHPYPHIKTSPNSIITALEIIQQRSTKLEKEPQIMRTKINKKCSNKTTSNDKTFLP